MKRIILPLLLLSGSVFAQDVMTPELLWSLKRVGAQGLSQDGKTLYYSSRKYDWTTEESVSTKYALDIKSGNKQELSTTDGKSVIRRDKNSWYAVDGKALYISKDKGATWKSIHSGLEGAGNISISPDGAHIMYSKEILVKKMMGTDIYKDLPKTTVQIYTDLNYRHWDTWEDGKYSHVFVAPVGGEAKDIIGNKPFDVPQMPFGGAEDMIWTPDSKGVVYVCKKKYGKEYAISTNTDIYHYEIASGNTINLTTGMMGYDMSPSFSPDGTKLAWTSMRRDGYEADKNDIVVMEWNTSSGYKRNMTSMWDNTVNGFEWSNDSRNIFLTAATKGTVQLYNVGIPVNLMSKILPRVSQVTKGTFDVNGIVGKAANGNVIVSRRDMNHAPELYSVNIENGSMKQLTNENADIYSNLQMSKTELRMIETKSGEMMGTWVIYPPNFDPNKKYPTLLYCQGGPQSALSQFYSFRWNFQLMAANGYIVVAPNRHGMPGWGVKWNESISKDWGGKPMEDYLAAIDEVAKEDYVDNNRLGCIGASYGGYSVFMLAGMHNKRFKSFIAHDGLFDLKSWYGTTEELWFANWDIGGPYWETPKTKTYLKYDPSNYVSNWDAPIMIIQGGLDFRVGIEQGLEAFQAAQLRGIKSKLLYFPNENHWVLHAQNGIAWHREFFKWLAETVK